MLYKETSLFQMQISELSWKKASYVEATSYILPDSDKELGDVKGGHLPQPPSLTVNKEIRSEQ